MGVAGRFAANREAQVTRSASVRCARLQPNLPRNALERFATSAPAGGAKVGAEGRAGLSGWRWRLGRTKGGRRAAPNAREDASEFQTCVAERSGAE